MVAHLYRETDTKVKELAGGKDTSKWKNGAENGDVMLR